MRMRCAPAHSLLAGPTRPIAGSAASAARARRIQPGPDQDVVVHDGQQAPARAVEPLVDGERESLVGRVANGDDVAAGLGRRVPLVRAVLDDDQLEWRVGVALDRGQAATRELAISAADHDDAGQGLGRARVALRRGIAAAAAAPGSARAGPGPLPPPLRSGDRRRRRARAAAPGRACPARAPARPRRRRTALRWRRARAARQSRRTA